MIRPRGNLVLLEVDPENRYVGESKAILAPDEKALKFCRRCGVMMEGLSETLGCALEEEWKLDERTDTYYINDIQRRHDIVSEKFPVVTEGSRWATVLACGMKVCLGTPPPGSRVLIDAEAGVYAPGTPYRLVCADALMLVEVAE